MGKKIRMGRGLDDLYSENNDENVAEEKQVETEENGNAMSVRLSLVEPNKSQPRDEFDEEKLEELAESIKVHGVLQPILVRPLENGGYQIVAGERRWRASRIAGLTEIPVLVKDLSDKETMQIALIENVQRQDLSPIEEAIAYQKLITNYEMTQQEVAEAVGKSRSAIANSLRILNLNDLVKGMISEGKLSVGHGKILAGLSDEEQIAYATQCGIFDWSVRNLEEQIALDSKSKEEVLVGGKKKVKENSFAKQRPFLKEFEVAVNSNSNIKAKIKAQNDGGALLSLQIGKECDMESVLSKLADVLTNY